MRPRSVIGWISLPAVAATVLVSIAIVRLQPTPIAPYDPGSPTPVARPEGVFSGKVDWSAHTKLDFSSHYIVDLPPGYNPQSGVKYPLEVYMHSAGGASMTFGQFREIARPEALAKASDRYPTIILFPHLPSQEITWKQIADPLNDLLTQIVEQYPVDTHRIYLVGYSDGGYGALAFGARYPQRFAGVAEISGYYDSQLDELCALKDTPVFIYHGEDDQVISIQAERQVEDTLKGCGGNVTATIFKKTDHFNITQQTLEDIQFYNRLFQNILATQDQ